MKRSLALLFAFSVFFCFAGTRAHYLGLNSDEESKGVGGLDEFHGIAKREADKTADLKDSGDGTSAISEGEGTNTTGEDRKIEEEVMELNNKGLSQVQLTEGLKKMVDELAKRFRELIKSFDKILDKKTFRKMIEYIGKKLKEISDELKKMLNGLPNGSDSADDKNVHSKSKGDEVRSFLRSESSEDALEDSSLDKVRNEFRHESSDEHRSYRDKPSGDSHFDGRMHCIYCSSCVPPIYFCTPDDMKKNGESQAKTSAEER